MLREIKKSLGQVTTGLDNTRLFAGRLEQVKEQPNEAARLLRDDQEVLRKDIEEVQKSVLLLADISTYSRVLVHGQHARIWPHLNRIMRTRQYENEWVPWHSEATPLLHVFETNAAKASLTPVPVTDPPAAGIYPDLRIGLQASMYAATTWLTLMRTMLPEFRSTSEGRETLRRFAALFETLAENMLRTTLARTTYTREMFAHFSLPEDCLRKGHTIMDYVIDPDKFPGFVVGAIDLIAHDDNFFSPNFDPQFCEGTYHGPYDLSPEQAKQGLLDLRWIPPAKMKIRRPGGPRGERFYYSIDNPQECADAANALAEEAYVNLMYSRGYLNLIHLIATLRNEATDPDSSQTVSIPENQKPLLKRRPVEMPRDVGVEGPSSHADTNVGNTATVVPHQYVAKIVFTTQPNRRSWHTECNLKYRVVLRTLPQASKTYHEDYYRVGYIDDKEFKGFQKLNTQKVADALDECELVQGTSPWPKPTEGSGVPVPPEHKPKRDTGTAKLEAVTFDLWMQGAPPTLADSFTEVLPDDPLWTAEAELAGRRKVRGTQTVELDYAWTWTEGELVIELYNRLPAWQGLNYVVYVVVEETLGSGNVLHTAERVPVTGLIMYLPPGASPTPSKGRGG